MKNLVLIFFVFAMHNIAFSQSKTIRGKVVDETKNPISNVSVLVKGTSRGVTTNDKGEFEFLIPANAKKIVFSSVGYNGVEVSAEGSSTFNIVLEAKKDVLNEVVVTALGISKDRKSLGYATQNIKSDAIIDKGDGSLLNALQGKIAGADIIQSSGAAGASTSILLRGVTSFTGSQSPLIVLDGVPISNSTDESTVGLYSAQASNRLADLNLNNVESVNVLQGPAASALYGSRAAHGAIMITTKKGSGKKNTLDVIVNTSFTQQQLYGFPELQNTYGQGANGVFNAISTNSLGPAFTSTPSLVNGLVAAPNTAPYVNGITYTPGQTIPFTAFPNNIKDYFRTGYIFDQNLTINSGDAKNYYSIVVGNSDQVGVMPNNGFKKTNIGYSASTQLNSKLSVKSSASFFSTSQTGTTQGTNGSYSSYANVVRTPRSVDMDYFINNYLTKSGYNNWFIPNVYNVSLQDSSSGGDNPYFAAYKNPVTSSLYRFLGNVTMAYDIKPWLNISYRAGMDAYTDRRKRVVAIGSAQVVRSAFTGTPGTTTGGIMEDVFFRSELNGDLMVTAKKNDLLTKGLNATFLLGHGVNQQKFQQVNQTGYSLTIPDYYNITNASNLSLSNEYNSTKRLWGVYGQLSLAYHNYLFLELTGRQDHSSSLPIKKSSFFYPSASLSFVITDALKLNSKALSFAKVRMAYAKVGNDAPVYSLDNTFSSASAGNNVASYAFPFGTTAGFAASTTLGNKELTPEFISSLDLGINLGFFDNRINIDATVYNSKSTDQIVAVGLPASSGYLRKFVNIGEMTNKGAEITLSAFPVRNKNVVWQISGNFSFNRNKVTYIAPGVTSFSFGGINFSGLIPTIAVGEAYGIIRGGKFIRNSNGDLLIDSTTGQFANYLTDQTVMDPNRKWTMGVTNSITFKGISLSFLVDYKHGGQFESFTAGVLRANGSLKITENRDKPFILPGVIDMGGGKYKPNNIQISGQSYFNAALGSTTGSTTSNEFFVMDASVLRLRELSIGYDLKGTKIGLDFIKNLRLTAYGRNLFFYAPNSPIDPDLSTQGAGTGTSGGHVRGLELVSIPNTRNLGVSLRITF